jgi:hypothetical protein
VVVGSNKGDPKCINKFSRIYVTQHPPVHHPLEIHYEPIVDEPKMSSSTIKVNSSSKPAYFITLPLPVYTLNPIGVARVVGQQHKCEHDLDNRAQLWIFFNKTG